MTGGGGGDQGPPAAASLRVGRRSPPGGGPADAPWALVVTYRVNGRQRVEELRLRDEALARRVAALLDATEAGNGAAAGALYACLHQEWAGAAAGRSPAWEAALRYLSPLAAAPAPAPADADAPVARALGTRGPVDRSPL